MAGKGERPSVLCAQFLETGPTRWLSLGLLKDACVDVDRNTHRDGHHAREAG